MLRYSPFNRFACPSCQCEQSIPTRGASGLTPSYFHACVQETSRLIEGGQVECTSCQTDKYEYEFALLVKDRPVPRAYISQS